MGLWRAVPVLSGMALGAAAYALSAKYIIDEKPSREDAVEYALQEFELSELSIQDLQNLMSTGQHTAVSLTQLYINRIAVVDKLVNSITSICKDALQQAAELDAERQRGHVRGPLHGIPILIKDNIGIRGEPTTAGSLALAHNVQSKDSHHIALLRKAGAVIFGRANLSEFAYFRSDNGVSGWSAVGGQIRNPYALDRSPSGSSGGSAVAASANLCAGTIGSETGGSIIAPSNVCGIVGLKPSVGIVSRSGVVPISSTQDSTGPMTRTVADVAILLSAIAGVDSNDPATLEAGAHIHADYTQFLQKDALRGARIGVLRNLAGFRDTVQELFNTSVQTVKDAGAIVVDDLKFPFTSERGYDWERLEMEVMLFEFKHGLNAYLASTDPELVSCRTIDDVIEFNKSHASVEMPTFGQELIERSAAKGELSDQAYVHARSECNRMTQAEGIDTLLREHNLDALMAPSGTPAYLIDHIKGDHFQGSSANIAAVAGNPQISVPNGFVHGLPVGVLFIGGRWAEPTIIKLAYAYEQLTHARKPPPISTHNTYQPIMIACSCATHFISLALLISLLLT